VIFWVRTITCVFAAALLALLAAKHLFGVANLGFYQGMVWPLMLAGICLEVFLKSRQSKLEAHNG